MRERDTTPDAARVQDDLYRRMSGARRLELAAAMCDDARELSRAGIRARHPDYTELDTKHALFRLLLGDTLYRAAWPNLPLLDP